MTPDAYETDITTNKGTVTLEVLRSDNYDNGLGKAGVKEDAVSLTNF